MGLDPTKKFQIFEKVVVFRKLRRQLDGIIVSSLRYPSDGLKKVC